MAARAGASGSTGTRALCCGTCTGLVRAVGVSSANLPEASVRDAIMADLERQEAQLGELHIDRGYLSSRLVRERPPELATYCKCKASPIRNEDRFPIPSAPVMAEGPLLAGRRVPQALRPKKEAPFRHNDLPGLKSTQNGV